MGEQTRNTSVFTCPGWPVVRWRRVEEKQRQRKRAERDQKERGKRVGSHPEQPGNKKQNKNQNQKIKCLFSNRQSKIFLSPKESERSGWKKQQTESTSPSTQFKLEGSEALLCLHALHYFHCLLIWATLTVFINYSIVTNRVDIRNRLLNFRSITILNFTQVFVKMKMLKEDC